jgi:DNA-binding CsgD family transcriptional regulator
MLPHALTVHSGIYIVAGEFATAEALSDEAREICAATGVPTVHTARLMLAAWRGEAETPALIEACSEEAISRGEGRTLAAADAAGATFYNGLGRYADALAPARRSREHREETGFSTWGLVELVEAASRSGKPDLAADALSQLEETTGTAGTDWALGVEAGSRALLSEGEVAEELHREAIARLARTRARPWLARAHLVYGEWLRREKRRLDAREQLRIAHEMLSAMGVKGFAERAARELCATGETARKRTPDTRDELTAREAQIALLARDGLSNPQIGARLFVSPSTVDYHLRKVFAKLDIRTRHELDRVLPRQLDAAAA